MQFERVIELEGATNVRDLGGYVAADGRSVQWRRILRGSRLGHLSGNDLRVFSEIGVRTICDFRSVTETGDLPNRRMEHTVTSHAFPIEPKVKPYLDRLVADRSLTEHDPHELMLEVYRSLVKDHLAEYRSLLSLLVDAANAPLLFHCTAGKDRTGFAAALILRLLGVPMETVMEDYLLTNRHWGGTGALEGAPAALRQALTRVNEAYLMAAFDTIDAQYGTFAAFAEQGLGFDGGKLERLTDAYLE